MKKHKIKGIKVINKLCAITKNFDYKKYRTKNSVLFDISIILPELEASFGYHVIPPDKAIVRLIGLWHPLEYVENLTFLFGLNENSLLFNIRSKKDTITFLNDRIKSGRRSGYYISIDVLKDLLSSYSKTLSFRHMLVNYEWYTLSYIHSPNITVTADIVETFKEIFNTILTLILISENKKEQ